MGRHTSSYARPLPEAPCRSHPRSLRLLHCQPADKEFIPIDPRFLLIHTRDSVQSCSYRSSSPGMAQMSRVLYRVALSWSCPSLSPEVGRVGVARAGSPA